ncbi:MAG: RluA family pseudouridine synthase [bacterium]
MTVHQEDHPHPEWRVYDRSRQQKWRIAILHEDGALLALNKPAGLPVIPERWHPDWPCLKSIATEQLGARIWVVHRLDAGTSGVVLFAKTAEAHHALCEQFTQRRVEKVYWAIVQGNVETEEHIIQMPLAPHPKKPGMMIVHESGKAAATTIRVLERFRHFSLVEARPLTGRQHQIRVHLQAWGHPLVVDPLYARTEALFLSALKANYRAKGEELPLLGRLALHAVALRLAHPLRREPFTIHAALPKDFNATVKNLRKYDVVC